VRKRASNIFQTGGDLAVGRSIVGGIFVQKHENGDR
jgi:hypothetical protein